ncbi:hypothetical protein [Herbaspirillum sp. SJZ099]|uniref:hypothetical protein n=1 Tax=Herbaspirillum sp. SJZ099 TaxID=2572916 RepID=UPI00119F2F71|nr:hypothetical protein [Herbaspirillum sp. SJZ099]TWC67292.1 hypothetical protein FB597_104102 [Herbaspirillum sp. SJZ099]
MLDPTYSDHRAEPRLWGLVKAADGCLPGEESHKTFYIRNGDQAGVLAFASALDAEIYRQQLLGLGLPGWQRAPLENIDLDRIMSGQPQQQRKLMLALGFFASDTNDLLLDDQQMLITPLLPVPVRLAHTLHGLSQLHIEREVLDFVEQWWDRVGGEHYSGQVRIAACWSDLQLAQSARNALACAAMESVRRYHAMWKETGGGDECAVFSPDTGVWHFSTLHGPRQRALH